MTDEELRQSADQYALSTISVPTMATSSKTNSTSSARRRMWDIDGGLSDGKQPHNDNDDGEDNTSSSTTTARLIRDTTGDRRINWYEWCLHHWLCNPEIPSIQWCLYPLWTFHGNVQYIDGIRQKPLDRQLIRGYIHDQHLNRKRSRFRLVIMKELSHLIAKVEVPSLIRDTHRWMIQWVPGENYYSDQQLPIGCSKIGGLPDLPIHLSTPMDIIGAMRPTGTTSIAVKKGGDVIGHTTMDDIGYWSHGGQFVAQISVMQLLRDCAPGQDTLLLNSNPRLRGSHGLISIWRHQNKLVAYHYNGSYDCLVRWTPRQRYHFLRTGHIPIILQNQHRYDDEYRGRADDVRLLHVIDRLMPAYHPIGWNDSEWRRHEQHLVVDELGMAKTSGIHDSSSIWMFGYPGQQLPTAATNGHDDNDTEANDQDRLVIHLERPSQVESRLPRSKWQSCSIESLFG
jgi:hypothetical protein